MMRPVTHSNEAFRNSCAILISMLCIALSPHNARAQGAGIFQMHYDARVRNFAQSNNGQQSIVLLGDSITEGFDIAKWFPFRPVLNRGIGGDVIGAGLPKDDKRGVIRRLGVSVLDIPTTHVFLMIGTNDLGGSRSLTVMREGYREILQTIRKQAPGVTVHVQSVLPARGVHGGRNPAVVEFNSQIKQLAAEFDFPYLDLHSLFVNSHGELNEGLTPDGLHLNDAGYAIWKDAIDREMGWKK